MAKSSKDKAEEETYEQETIGFELSDHDRDLIMTVAISYIRFKCLELAVEKCETSEAALTIAEIYFKFVQGVEDDE